MNITGLPLATVCDGVVTLTGFSVSVIEAEWTTIKRKRDPLNLRAGLLFAGDTPLMTDWTDWIDYWAVDFDFGGTFRSVWQDFRTKAKRTIELTTPPHECGGVVRVQVIDIFANEHYTTINSEAAQ